MRELAGGKLTDEFLKNLWMQRLPTHVQSILSASTEGLSQLTILADKICEIAMENATVYATSLPEPPTVAAVATQADIADLRQQVAQLTRQIERLSRERSRSRGGTRIRPKAEHKHRDHNKIESNSDTKYCFYHDRFGMNARKCRAPCTFNQQGNE